MPILGYLVNLSSVGTVGDSDALVHYVLGPDGETDVADQAEALGCAGVWHQVECHRAGIVAACTGRMG